MPVTRVTTGLKWRGKKASVKGKNMTKKTVWEAALFVEGQWKLLAAVDTGRYAGSITVEMRDRATAFSTMGTGVPEAGDKIGKPRNPLDAVIGTNVFYAPYVEYGTVKTHAQPAARPALDLARGKTLQLARKNGRQEFVGY